MCLSFFICLYAFFSFSIAFLWTVCPYFSEEQTMYSNVIYVWDMMEAISALLWYKSWSFGSLYIYIYISIMSCTFLISVPDIKGVHGLGEIPWNPYQISRTPRTSLRRWSQKNKCKIECVFYRISNKCLVGIRIRLFWGFFSEVGSGPVKPSRIRNPAEMSYSV